MPVPPASPHPSQPHKLVLNITFSYIVVPTPGWLSPGSTQPDFTSTVSNHHRTIHELILGESSLPSQLLHNHIFHSSCVVVIMRQLRYSIAKRVLSIYICSRCIYEKYMVTMGNLLGLGHQWRMPSRGCSSGDLLFPLLPAGHWGVFLSFLLLYFYFFSFPKSDLWSQNCPAAPDPVTESLCSSTCLSILQPCCSCTGDHIGMGSR